MIVSNISGGLGNQLFQYAFGLSLSLKYDTELVLDFNDFKVRSALFRSEIDKLVDNKHFDRNTFYKSLNIFKEPNLSYNPDFVDKIPDDSYVTGYWQSPKYFQHIRNSIIDNIWPRHRIVNKIFNKIVSSENPVAIHIRLGDRISNRINNVRHGFCNYLYYRKAIKKIKEVVDDPIFFVFSDDTDNAGLILSEADPDTIFIFIPSSIPIFDLFIMTECKHFIIANSSFSWWGAWLSSYENKTIIAPDRMTRDERYNSPDIIPEDWVKIEAFDIGGNIGN